MVTKSISIIIPCYNEEANLKRGVLDEVESYLNNVNFKWEVLICNDKSTDNSLNLINNFVETRPKFRVLDLPKGGKAGAIWGGIQQSKYDIVLFTDMDQSTPLKELSKFLPYFEKNYDLVIGSRGHHREGNTFTRKLGSKVFMFARNFLLKTNIIDTQCGFKAIKTKLAKEIFPQLAVIKNIQNREGWKVSAYDVEMLLIAQKMGKKIKEVEVEWKNEDTSTTKGDANARYIKESQEMAKEVWRIFVNNLKGAYDK
jgi:dolichyl-phosphate beta-glucosyltransferase